MPPGTPYFDLLDDPLVQLVIRAFPKGHVNSCGRNLSATCRRMCTLVRSTAVFAVSLNVEHALGMTRVPASRAFCSLVLLTLRPGLLRNIHDWAQFAEAAAAAAATWPQLQHVQLGYGMQDRNDPCEPGCLSSALMALKAVPALRSLDITCCNPASLVYLPLLTQLSQLAAGSDGPMGLVAGTSNRPLAAMPHLVDLQLRNIDLSRASGPCVLPPNLTRLELQLLCWVGAEGWSQNVAACRQLQELYLVTNEDDLHTHPTLVIQALAGQLSQLRKLYVDGDEAVCEWGAEQLEEVMEELTPAGDGSGSDQDDVEGQEEDEEGLHDLPQLPLGEDQGYTEVDGYVAVPPPNMGGLPALQHLELEEWWLVLSTQRHWRALGACRHLQTLPELHVSMPPPAGVTFPGVTRLEVTTSTSPGDTWALLAAFPALKELDLDVVLKARHGDARGLPGAGRVVLHHLTSATVFFHHAPAVADSLRDYVRTYCRALWSALPRLQQLELAWATPVRLLSHQLGLSALQQLTGLVLGAKAGRVREGAEYHFVGRHQLVRLVQGVTQLQALSVQRPLAPGSSKVEVVLGLQGALPRLVRLVVEEGVEGLAPATLAALRPGLAVSGFPWKDGPAADEEWEG